ncbi:tetratricopeptide repeat protein [Roseiconus lacunae]|uniref:tetratricopeptide repeat protein n=1 Tax=Roseiconus lacunae TaxID=2605694 RepID=UPI001E572746|nr:tetratricopeptide repeat protein [Roseiconus lacunae]MCD0457878.1 tetratricopeptide repeat protein [Roseiconus lacunae]
MQLTTEQVRLLFEVGIMAAWQGDTTEARAIMDGIQAARPDSTAPIIGIAISLMNEGDLVQAANVLEQEHQQHPECNDVRLYLAMANKLSGYDDRCQQLCRGLPPEPLDTAIGEVARILCQIPTESSMSELAG